MSKPKDIFISYNSDDEEFVEKFYDELIDYGFFVWFDRQSIITGDEWVENIKKGMRECSLVIVCIGKPIEDKGFQIDEIFVAKIRFYCKQSSIFPAKIHGYIHDHGNEKRIQCLFKKIQIHSNQIKYVLTKFDVRSIYQKLHKKNIKQSKKICEKKLRELFVKINYNSYREYIKKTINDKISTFVIIGNDMVFKFHEELTKELLGLDQIKSNKIYIAIGEKISSNIILKKLYKNDNFDYLFFKPKINQLINRIKTKGEYVFISFHIESETNITSVKKECDKFLKNFEKVIKFNSIRLFFSLFIEFNPGSIFDKILPFKQFNFYKNDFISLDEEECNTEKCLQELINRKKIFDKHVLKNSVVLFEELNKLICNQEEIFQ